VPEPAGQQPTGAPAWLKSSSHNGGRKRFLGEHTHGRFITIAGLAVSGVWLAVLALEALLPRF